MRTFGLFFDSLRVLGQGYAGSVYALSPRAHPLNPFLKAKGPRYILKSVRMTKDEDWVKRLQKWVGGVRPVDEIMVGSELNEVRGAMFMKTVDWFRCNDEALRRAFQVGYVPDLIRDAETMDAVFMVVERVEGPSMLDELVRRANNPQYLNMNVLRAVSFQVFFSMALASRDLGFSHLDLHVDNVMFDQPVRFECPELEGEFWEYCLDDLSTGSALNRACRDVYRIPKSLTCGARPVIIDLGNGYMSRPEYTGRALGPRLGKHFTKAGQRMDMRFFMQCMLAVVPLSVKEHWKLQQPQEWNELKQLWKMLFLLRNMMPSPLITRSSDQNEWQKASPHVRHQWLAKMNMWNTVTKFKRRREFTQILSLPFYNHFRISAQ